MHYRYLCTREQYMYSTCTVVLLDRYRRYVDMPYLDLAGTWYLVQYLSGVAKYF